MGLKKINPDAGSTYHKNRKKNWYFDETIVRHLLILQIFALQMYVLTALI